MTDMPEPIPVINSVTDHALTSVAVDLLGTGIDHQVVEFLYGSSVVDHDVLETMPDVSVRQGDNLILPCLVDLGNRFQQWLGRQGYLLMTDALQTGTKFVAIAFATPVPIIVILPGQVVGLIVDPIADDCPGLQ